MKDKYLQDIEKINQNIDILPTNNKSNISKYNEYIEEQINTYNHEQEEIKKEISLRYNKYLKEFNQGEDIKNPKKLDIDLIRCLDKKTTSYEKMNLGYYLYQLDHFYETDIDKVNNIIIKIIDLFKNVNISIKDNDFIYSESVKYYIDTLLSSKDHIHEILDKLYWENPNLITQIKLNFRNIYFKNEKNIDKFYALKYNHQDLNSYLKEIFINRNEINNEKHHNKKYLFNLFLDGTLSVVDFKDKTIDALIEDILLKKDSKDNYLNLCKLEQSLIENNSFMDFEYIVKDIKELYSKKTEYKGLYDSKLKEIKKKENTLFKLNKQINGKGLFNKNTSKNSKYKLDRNNVITELDNLYKELDSLRIKDLIYKYVEDNTSYLEVIRLSAIDYNYFVSLLKKQIDNLDLESIDENINKLYEFAFGINHNIFSNIALTEEKNINQIITDRYHLIDIKINEDDLTKDKIEKLLETIQNLIIYFDMSKIDINISNLDYVIKVEKIIKK